MGSLDDLMTRSSGGQQHLSDKQQQEILANLAPQPKPLTVTSHTGGLWNLLGSIGNMAVTGIKNDLRNPMGAIQGSALPGSRKAQGQVIQKVSNAAGKVDQNVLNSNTTKNVLNKVPLGNQAANLANDYLVKPMIQTGKDVGQVFQSPKSVNSMSNSQKVQDLVNLATPGLGGVEDKIATKLGGNWLSHLGARFATGAPIGATQGYVGGKEAGDKGTKLLTDTAKGAAITGTVNAGAPLVLKGAAKAPGVAKTVIGKSVGAVDDKFAKNPDKGTTYSLQNSDIKRTSNGYQVKELGGGATTYRNDALSPQTSKNLTDAEAAYAKAKDAGTGGRVKAQDNLAAAHDAAIRELGIQRHAVQLDKAGVPIKGSQSTEYAKWAEGKFKDPGTTYDEAKHIAENPGAHQDQFKQETATPAPKGPIKSGLSAISAKAAAIKTKAVDSMTPLTNIAKGTAQEAKMEQGQTKFFGQSAKVDQEIKSNLQPAVRSVKDKQALSDYLVAQRDQELAARGVKGSPNQSRAADIISDTEAHPEASKIKAAAQKIYDLQNGKLDEMVKAGMISKDSAEAIKASGEHYIPMKRVLDEADSRLSENGGGGGKGKGPASVSTQNVVQKLEGSDLAVHDPIQSITQNMRRMEDVMRRNELAHTTIEAMREHGVTAPLRTAENVNRQLDLRTMMKESKPVANGLARLIKTGSKQIRSLQSEIGKLNLAGLNKSLKGGGTEPTPNFNVEGLAKLGTRDTQGFVKSLVEKPRSEIEAIKSKIATRENKLGPTLDRVAELSDMLHQVKAERSAQMDEHALIKKAEAQGQFTVSRYKDGVHEVWTAPKEIAEAAKGMGGGAVGAGLKIASMGTRVFRILTTDDPAFVMVHVLRDAQRVYKTTGVGPLSSLVKGTAHILGRTDTLKEYKNNYAKVGFGTKIDEHANQMTADDIKGRGIKILNPKTLLKVGWHRWEAATQEGLQTARVGVFSTKLQEYMGKGMSREEAALKAAHDAQESAGNFGRHGSSEGVRAFNALYAFVNARVQGMSSQVSAFKKNPGAFTARLGASVVAPTLILYAWNRTQPGYNDPKIVTQNDKDNNFILMLPDGKHFIKVPKDELGKFANPIEAYLAHEDGRGSGDLGKDLKKALGTANPAGMQNIMPTALAPINEVLSNKNSFGTPLVPDSLSGLPAKDQASSGTQAIYRQIGSMLNVSPNQVKAIVEGYGSITAGLVANNTQGLFPKDMRSTTKDGSDIVNKIPVLDRIVGGQKYTQAQVDGSTYVQAKDLNRTKLTDAGDRSAYDQYFARNHDNTGKTIQGTPHDRMIQAGLLYGNDNVRKAITATERSTKGHDPLWDQPDSVIKSFENYKQFATGGADAIAYKQQHPEIQTIEDAQNKYYAQNQFKSTALTNPNNPVYPLNAFESGLMAQAGKITDSTARNEFYQAHPELTQIEQKYGQYVNAERKQEGYAPLPSPPAAPKVVQDFMNAYLSKTATAASKKLLKTTNPEGYAGMENYLSQSSVYGLMKQASIDQLTGGVPDQKFLKDAYSLGQYDIQKNSDGTYSLSNATATSIAGGSGKSGSSSSSKLGGGGVVGSINKTTGQPNVTHTKFGAGLDIGKTEQKIFDLLGKRPKPPKVYNNTSQVKSVIRGKTPQKVSAGRAKIGKLTIGKLKP